jgi:hypothetical protein
MTKLTPRHSLLLALLSLVAIAVPTASAASLLTPVALLTGKGADCQGRVLSQPFSPWGDQATYFPVANGSFEGGAAGWTMAGGASVTSGGDPFLSGSAGASLNLPAGSSATTPASCVDLGSPTLRFFASGQHASVTVSVLVAGLAVPVGSVSASGAWSPTPAFVYLTNALGILSPTGTVNASFRFTASGGDVHVDDVYIDPYRRT